MKTLKFLTVSLLALVLSNFAHASADQPTTEFHPVVTNSGIVLGFTTNSASKTFVDPAPGVYFVFAHDGITVRGTVKVTADGAAPVFTPAGV